MSSTAHLSTDDLLAIAESRGSDAARRHVDDCASCAAAVEDVRATLRLVAADEIPEPSPLFWEHLSARIGRAIDEEAPPVIEPWWRRRLAWVPASAAALAVLGLVVATVGRYGPRPPEQGFPASGSAGVAALVSPPVGTEPLPAEDDATWDVVAVLSAGLADDGAESAAFDAQPGSVERVIEDLSAEERGELVRLLEAELARRPS